MRFLWTFGNIQGDVQRESRLTHGRSRSNDDQVGRLEAKGIAVEFTVFGIKSCECCPKLSLFGDFFHQIISDRPGRFEIGCPFFLGDSHDLFFNIVDKFGCIVGRIGIIDDLTASVLDLSQNRLVFDNVNIVKKIGSGRHGIDKPGEIIHSSGFDQKIQIFPVGR